MGRHPKTNPENAAAESAGALSPTQWVRVVLGHVFGGHTGTLTIRNGTHERTFRILQGVPVSAVSTVPDEDFTETMVGVGVLEQARLDWIRKHTGAEESETEALIGAGTIERSTVDSHHCVHIQHLLGAGLSWSDGEYEWHENTAVSDRFEATLIPNVDVIQGLLGGVLGSFDLGALRTFIDAADAGDFLPDTRMTTSSTLDWLPHDMRAIRNEVGQGSSRAQMAEALSCDADRLAALLWLLEAAGWLRRAQPPADLIPMGTVATIQQGQPERTETVSAQPPAPAAQAIRTAPVRSQKTPAPKQAVSPTSAPDATPKKPAKSTPASKPKAPAAPDSGALLRQAITALEAQDFDSAYPLLINARKERPSCPDTLSALGWAAWRTGNLGTNAYDGPEDFLLLALTFDAKHPKALEYYARIAIDKGEVETARNRLLQVLQVSPDAAWAKEALEESGASRKGGIRLWPKSS